MCGIAGAVLRPDAPGDERRGLCAAVRRMSASMARRGPDDEHHECDPAGQVHLGFRRLAILDLTSAGRQPMTSADGRSTIVYNGELYNFRELRRELQGAGLVFRSRTDTEVVLEALNLWGPDALRRFNGMFALAWWSTARRRLLLARDHAGIKPLYYAVSPAGDVAFASEYDALLEAPWVDLGSVRRDVLELYLRLHHIPAPYALLDRTHQLEPGHAVEIEPGVGVVRTAAWWSLPRAPGPDLRGREALDKVVGAIDGAIARQLVADVPLGVFLSGGVDSPLVTAVARRHVKEPLRAFTIATPGWWQDEGEDAARLASAIGVDHVLLPVDEVAAARVVQHVVDAQHEPLADFSILPTLLVSGLARRDVTVALSGDGGDELFFGYQRPLSLLRNGVDFRWPWPVRLALYYAGRLRLGRRRSDAIVARTPGDYYLAVNSRFGAEPLGRLAPGLPGLPADFGLYRCAEYRGLGDLAHYSRYVEYYGQLQRVLKKVDMASMYHSLEVRVPLLDREVVETSLRVDPFAAMRDGVRKAILRDALATHVPREAIPTQKRGFAVPLGKWLRGSLRSIAEGTLLDAPLWPDGVFVRAEVERYWRAHRDGQADHKWGIWTLLALKWWSARARRRRAVTSDHRDGRHADPVLHP